jgi:hypothetical protein
MVDADFFLESLPTQILGYQLAAYVRIVTNGADYLVRDVIRTYASSVTVNVWLDSKGLAPIVAGSSNIREFEVLPPVEYKGITIPFEQIVEVVVVPAPQTFGRFSVS